MKNRFISKMALFASTVLFAATGMAQSSVNVGLVLDQSSYLPGPVDGTKVIDLVKEIEKVRRTKLTNLEIYAVSFRAKTGLGVAQVNLEINQQLVNGETVEGIDPDRFMDNDPRTYSDHVIYNYERGVITSAKLILQPSANLRLAQVEVQIGAAKAIDFVGQYDSVSMADLSGVQGQDSGSIRETRPAPSIVGAPVVVAPVVVAQGEPVAPVPTAPAPVAVAPVVPAAPTPPSPSPARNSIQAEVLAPMQTPLPAKNVICGCNAAKLLVCEGDQIVNRFGEKGIILEIKQRRKGKLDDAKAIVEIGYDVRQVNLSKALYTPVSRNTSCKK